MGQLGDSEEGVGAVGKERNDGKARENNADKEKIGKKKNDLREQELLKRTTVAEGADAGLLAAHFRNFKEPRRSPEEQANYEQRLARLQAAFEARKKKLAEKRVEEIGEKTG